MQVKCNVFVLAAYFSLAFAVITSNRSDIVELITDLKTKYHTQNLIVAMSDVCGSK